MVEYSDATVRRDGRSLDPADPNLFAELPQINPVAEYENPYEFDLPHCIPPPPGPRRLSEGQPPHPPPIESFTKFYMDNPELAPPCSSVHDRIKKN